MSKQLGSGMDALFNGSKIRKLALKEDKPLEKRATFIVNCDLLERAKLVAYWERLKLKDIINEALRAYLSKMEKNADGHKGPS